MRGENQRSEELFSYVPLERRILAGHPLRAIRRLTDEALAGLSRDFNKLYARDGRPSIPPERLLRALLLQALYTVRSERQLMEQLDYNLLYRWFVGLSADRLEKRHHIFRQLAQIGERPLLRPAILIPIALPQQNRRRRTTIRNGLDEHVRIESHRR